MMLNHFAETTGSLRRGLIAATAAAYAPLGLLAIVHPERLSPGVSRPLLLVLALGVHAASSAAMARAAGAAWLRPTAMYAGVAAAAGAGLALIVARLGVWAGLADPLVVDPIEFGFECLFDCPSPLDQAFDVVSLVLAAGGAAAFLSPLPGLVARRGRARSTRSPSPIT